MQQYLRIILTIIIGIITGIINGSTGLGGSFIIIPLFLLFNIIADYTKTIGTTMFAVLFPMSILSILEYAKNKDIDYFIGVILTITVVIFYYIGTKLHLFLEKKNKLFLLKYLSSIVLIMAGIYFGYDAYVNKLL